MKNQALTLVFVLKLLCCVSSQQCTFESSWIGKWFHYYDTSTDLPWVYDIRTNDVIVWELQNGANNIYLNLECLSEGDVGDRYYMLITMFNNPVCMQTTKMEKAILMRDQPITNTASTDYQAKLQTCPGEMSTLDKAQWFVQYPFDATGVLHPYPKGFYQGVFSVSLGLTSCVFDQNSRVIIEDTSFNFQTCFSGPNTYELPLSQKRLVVMAWTPGSDIDSDDNGDVVLLADVDNLAHPMFYCARIKVTNGQIAMSLDVQNPYEPECMSGHLSTTAVSGKYLALSLTQTTNVVTDPSTSTTTVAPTTSTTVAVTTPTPSTTPTPVTTPSPVTTPTPVTTPAPATATPALVTQRPSTSTTTTTRTATPLSTITTSTTTVRPTTPRPPSTTTPTVPTTTTTPTVPTTTTTIDTVTPATTTSTTPPTTSTTTTMQSTTTLTATTSQSTSSSTASTTESSTKMVSSTTSQRPMDACGGCIPDHGKCALFEDNTKKCFCFEGYYGTFCEGSNHPCDMSPCQNNGTCISRDKEFTCICTGKYYGKNCQMKYKPKDKEGEEDGQSMIMVILVIVLAVIIVAIVIIACIMCKRRRPMRKSSDKSSMVGEESSTGSSAVVAPSAAAAKQWYPAYAQYGNPNQGSSFVLVQQA